MTDRDREAFEAWFKTADRVVLDRYWAEEAWEAALAHAREAGAQEPVAVPARMTADEAWQDLCEKDDRTSIDYPGFALIRQDELAAYMAAAPVSPAADSGEVERLRTALEEISDATVHQGEGQSETSRIYSFRYCDPDETVEVALKPALASHPPAPQPVAWVNESYRDSILEHSGKYYWHGPMMCGKEFKGSFPVYLSAAALEPSPAQWNAGAEARVREALEWYAEQVAGCRKIGNIGDPARHELDRDGGKRAREALAALPLPTPAGEA